MLIIPAIDLKGGRCVRLIQGDPGKETVYSDDPIEVACSFEEAGAKLIHVVDLDGAFNGHPVHGDIVVQIAEAVNIPIEIGGGIRSVEDISFYREADISRIILGTAVLGSDMQGLVEAYKEVLVAGIDARNSMVATHGWKETSSRTSREVIGGLNEMGIRNIIYTDILTDGMLTGPNYNALEEIAQEYPEIGLVASGGISSMSDIEKLSRIADGSLFGCITGKAIYDKKIDLSRAIALYQH